MADDLQLERHIGRRLKLRELYILSTVVQWGSMAKAADHLAMSQPAVSDAIANLEETLDVRLLDRNRRGVEPTIYALALLKRGTVVFDELRQGLKDIEFLADPAAGEVRIACSQALAAGFVPAMIDKFSQRHPQVAFRLIEANTATMEFRDLRERNVDFMLGFVSRTLGRDDVNVDNCSLSQGRKADGPSAGRSSLQSWRTSRGSLARQITPFARSSSKPFERGAWQHRRTR